MSKAALEAEVDRVQAENDRLRHTVTDFNERIVCGQLTGKLPDNFLEQFGQLPDRPLEQVLRFLPAHQVVQMRRVSRKFNNLIKKCSRTMPKKESDGSISFKSYRAGEVEVALSEFCARRTTGMKLAGDKVALSELLRFIRIIGTMYFGEGVSAADEVLDQLTKEWLTIRPEKVIFAGDLSQTSRDSLRAFLVKVEPFVTQIQFQHAYRIPASLLSDDMIGAAGRLEGLVVMPACLGSKLRNINIGDETLLAMGEAKYQRSYCCLMGCSGITTGGIRAFIESYLKHIFLEPRPFFVINDQIVFESDHDHSVATLEAQVVRLQAENDRLGRTLSDIVGRIVCGRLTGDLPDNFLEQFSQLPDRPLEQVLRYLPPGQVAQMRLVSRKFNHLIRKCSRTMPKKGSKRQVMFQSELPGKLTVKWLRDSGNKITRRTITLADDEIALSELLRFFHIDGWMFFGKGLSAADKVLDQLSKAWLTIRPEVVVFSGDLSQTSRDSLRAFLAQVQPSIKQLKFQFPSNISDSLLSDDLIGVAGRLNGLMVLPEQGSTLRDVNIGDETLLSVVNTDYISSFFFVMGCSGITPGGIRAFLEKWMKKEKLKPDGKTFGLGRGLESCVLVFDNCANVTEAAVEEACGDLLKKETMAGADASSFDDSGEMNDHPYFTIYCPSTKRHLEIRFHIDSFISQDVKYPRVLIDDDSDQDIDDGDEDDEDDEDEEDEDDEDDDEDDEDTDLY
uniref:F-box domain-containing protein n=1 Tax=Plectus sambesii TaxID=2011161 RepID=A0A914VX16_9BILA